MSDPMKPEPPPGSPFPSGPAPGSPFPSGPPPGAPQGSPFPSNQNPYAGAPVPNIRESAGWKWNPLIGITYNGFPVGIVVVVIIGLLVLAGK